MPAPTIFSLLRNQRYREGFGDIKTFHGPLLANVRFRARAMTICDNLYGTKYRKTCQLEIPLSFVITKTGSWEVTFANFFGTKPYVHDITGEERYVQYQSFPTKTPNPAPLELWDFHSIEAGHRHLG